MKKVYAIVERWCDNLNPKWDEYHRETTTVIGVGWSLEAAKEFCKEARDKKFKELQQKSKWWTELEKRDKWRGDDVCDLCAFNVPSLVSGVFSWEIHEFDAIGS